MTVPHDEEINTDMGRGQLIALRTVQFAILVFAGWRLFRVNQDEAGVIALAWSIPWVILLIVATLLIPVLVKLGWRRFGRTGPTWTIATVVSTTTWAVVTILCWMIFGLVLLFSD
jgi:hypothetical protein